MTDYTQAVRQARELLATFDGYADDYEVPIWHSKLLELAKAVIAMAEELANWQQEADRFLKEMQDDLYVVRARLVGPSPR